MSVSDCVCVCSCVHVCVNMLMTLFVFTTCSFFIICHVRAGGLDECPLIGATATSTNEAFFATDETATLDESNTKKRPIFDRRLCFSVWSRLKSYDPISLKPHAGSPHWYPLTPKSKKAEAPTLTKFLVSECPEIWIRLLRYKRQRGWH